MNSTLREGLMHMDHASHLLSNAEGISILDRKTTLERQVGELRPTRLCAGLIRASSKSRSQAQDREQFVKLTKSHCPLGGVGGFIPGR